MRIHEQSSAKGTSSCRTWATLEPSATRFSVFIRLLLRLEAAVFARMPETQNEDRCVRDLVSQLVSADDDPPDLARLVGLKLLADPRVVEQSIRRAGELRNDARRRIGRDRPQMLMQPHQIRQRLAGPLDPHAVGGGNGLSVARLSAHAWIV